MHLSRYLKIYPCRDNPDKLFLYSTKRGAAILVSSTLLVAIDNDTLTQEDRATLTRLGIIVPDLARERQELQDALAEANRLRRSFSATVVLNLDCNLACTYCFEGGLKGKRYMSMATADRLVTMVERDQMAKGRTVELVFYGGEALLSIDLIRDMASRLLKSAQSHRVEFTFAMVTNGTLLTRRTVSELLPLGFTGAKVTLDGPPEIHDRCRPFVSGRGSFATILANMKATCDLIRIQVGGNYTRENYREFPRLLDLLLAEGLTPERLDLVKFDPVTKCGGEQVPPEFNDGCASINEPWVMEASVFLRSEILARGFQTPRVRPAPCMIESDHELVVNYDGSLYKCPAFMGWKEMAVGDLASGIGDFTVSHNLNVWKKDECLDCAYLPLCFGGCRLMKLVQEGRIDDVDCRKAYYDSTLESLVRQDLHHRPGRFAK
jgi:uncharacterized protein